MQGAVMSMRVLVTLPDEVYQQAERLAQLTRRDIADVLAETIRRSLETTTPVADLPVELLPDDQVLALCDLHLSPDQDAELSELLANNREGLLSDDQRKRLDHLIHLYRHGLVRKAQALKVAVERGLREPLG